MPFKPSVLERKVYNDDNKTFFSFLYLYLPSPCVIMCCSSHLFWHENAKILSYRHNVVTDINTWHLGSIVAQW